MKTKTLLIILASLTLLAVSANAQTQDRYQRIRKMDVLTEKKQALLALGHDARVQIWRAHFAYIFLTEDLEPEQREYLVRAVDAYEAGDLTDELNQEAKDLFAYDLGTRVFNLGPWKKTGSLCQVKKLDVKPRPSLAFAAFPSPVTRNASLPDCNCRQTGTNWSCSGSCDASNSCTKTPDGCSIFYMYPCDGKCSDNQIE